MKNNQLLLATVMTLSLSLGSLQGFASAPVSLAPDSHAPLMQHIQSPGLLDLSAQKAPDTLLACRQNEAGECKSWWHFWGGSKKQEEQASSPTNIETTTPQETKSDAEPNPLSPSEINRKNNTSKGYYTK
jgi:hypothetical protein